MGRTKQRRHASSANTKEPSFDASASKVRGITGYNAKDLDLSGEDLFQLQQDSIGLDEPDARNEDEDHDRAHLSLSFFLLLLGVMQD